MLKYITGLKEWLSFSYNQDYNLSTGGKVDMLHISHIVYHQYC